MAKNLKFNGYQIKILTRFHSNIFRKDCEAISRRERGKGSAYQSRTLR